MTDSIECWHCGRGLDDLPKPLSRRAVCPACEQDLHVCKMCEYYAISVAKSCREPIAEEVLDKVRANFCDYFRARSGAHSEDNAAVKARGELNALFGLDSTPSSTQAVDAQALEAQKQRKAEQASDELRRLFGLNDKD